MDKIVKGMATQAWASQFVENTHDIHRDLKFIVSRWGVRDIPRIVTLAFSWDCSPQGYDYWEGIYKRSIV